MSPTSSRIDEIESKLVLLRGLLERRGLDAAVLSGTDSVAWLTGGVTNRIEPGNPASPLWLVVTHDSAAAVTTNVERPRLEVEAGLGLELHEAPWFEPGGLERTAAALAGSERVGGAELDDDLIALRLALLPAERERLAALAADAAAALEDALRTWEPGERDFDVQARVAANLERVGAFGACLIVGGDTRVERFRHPLAAGEPMSRLVMAVVVAERGGLHAAATRFASAGPLPDSVREVQSLTLAVESAVLDACRTGATYGDVLGALAGAYSSVGHPGAWRDHYQGGPIGYRQREFELVPTQTASRWFRTELEAGHALAWNPSLPGGGKSEDTFLLAGGGLRQLTDTGDWPTVEVGGRARPAALDVATGGPA